MIDLIHVKINSEAPPPVCFSAAVCAGEGDTHLADRKAQFDYEKNVVGSALFM